MPAHSGSQAKIWWGYSMGGGDNVCEDLELGAFTFHLMPHQIDNVLETYAKSGDWDQVADRLVDVLQSAEETADLDRHGLLDITRDAPEANTITAVRAKLMVTGHTNALLLARGMTTLRSSAPDSLLFRALYHMLAPTVHALDSVMALAVAEAIVGCPGGDEGVAAAIDSGEKLLAKWNELVVFEGCYQKAVASAVAANERRRLLVDRMEAKVPGFHDVILDCQSRYPPGPERLAHYKTKFDAGDAGMLGDMHAASVERQQWLSASDRLKTRGDKLIGDWEAPPTGDTVGRARLRRSFMVAYQHATDTVELRAWTTLVLRAFKTDEFALGLTSQSMTFVPFEERDKAVQWRELTMREHGILAVMLDADMEVGVQQVRRRHRLLSELLAEEELSLQAHRAAEEEKEGATKSRRIKKGFRRQNKTRRGQAAGLAATEQQQQQQQRQQRRLEEGEEDEVTCVGSPLVCTPTTSGGVGSAGVWDDDGDDTGNGDDYDDDCVVCMERSRDVRNEPCGHVVMCHTCASAVMPLGKGCPYCRAEFSSFVCIAVSSPP